MSNCPWAKSTVRVCVRVFQASSTRDKSPLGASVQPWSADHTHHLLLDHTTHGFSHTVSQQRMLQSKEGRRSQWFMDKASRNEECTDPSLIYVHLIYLRSSQKKTLISALLGLLKDYSTEMLVEIFFVKLNKDSFNSQTNLENVTYYIFFLEIHSAH